MSPAKAVAAAVDRYRADPLYLVQIVREAQASLGWVSRETQVEIAHRLNIPITRVDAVVKFYSFFYDRPRGAYRVLFSDNITDRMAGSFELFNRMLGNFGVKRGEVSADGLVSIDLTSCIGMCDQGPAMLINNLTLSRLDERRIDRISELIKARTPLDHWPAEFFRVEDNVQRPGPLLGQPMTPGRALDAAIALGRQGVLDEMKRSNLRGRGGAGFACGFKWEAARNAPGADRYVIGNADEGEPGTFKDRVLLTSHAGRIFEGMAVAGYAIGATRGFLYLRGEYEYLKPRLEAELDRMRRVRRLGPSIRGAAGFDFDIEIHLGAGAYVCGEETALIESLEGKPGVRASARRSRCCRAIWGGPRWSTTSRPSVRRRKSSSTAAPTSPSAAPRTRRAPRSSRCPATARGRASTSTPSASPSHRSSRTPAPSRTSRRCRSAAPRGC